MLSCTIPPCKILIIFLDIELQMRSRREFVDEQLHIPQVFAYKTVSRRSTEIVPEFEEVPLRFPTMQTAIRNL